MPHITAKLHEDHRKVAQIFKKLKDTTDRAEKTRLDLCNKLKHELLAHAEFEEAVFYPTIRERNGADISEALEEHRQVKSMLEEIEQMTPASAEFMDKIVELDEAVKHHVEADRKRGVRGRRVSGGVELGGGGRITK